MEEIIYILTNDAMPGFIKIGKTLAGIEQRIKDLDNTSIPLPFQCFYAAKVNKAEFIERRKFIIFSESKELELIESSILGYACDTPTNK